MKNLKVAIENIKMNFKNAKELKSSFLISIFGMALNNIAFLLIWYYFGKTVGEINGWKPMYIFGLYAFSGITYGIICGIFGGILELPIYVSTGNFDKFLITPKSVLLKVSTSRITNSALGDLLFGLACFIIFGIAININLMQILLSIILLVIASLIFYSFTLICCSISFYLMDGNNVVQGLFSVFLSNTLYHGGAYSGLLRIIFVYVVPSLLVGAIPVELITNFNLMRFIMIIIFTILWFILSVIVFYKSLSKYESNNLFGFGS